MARRVTANEEHRMFLRAIAAYQWDWRVASNIIREEDPLTVEIRRGRIRYVYLSGRAYLTLRPGDGLLSLSLGAGERVREASDPPRYRVVVDEGVVLRGSVLAAGVVDIDPMLRPGDEVIVVSRDDELLGVGRLRVPPIMINGLSRGEVVRVRARRGD